MRANPLVWTLALLPLLVLSVQAGTVDTSRSALKLKLELPKVTSDYVTASWPAHFDARTLRDLDNTPRSNPLTNTGATLGRALFHDPLLSSTGKVSCASCHKQANAFSDNRRISPGVQGKLGKRNSMSLLNLRYHPTGRYFWDERAASLEEQVLGPIQDPNEMAMTLEELPVRVQLRAEYRALFKAAFGNETINNERIAKALAQFVRSIVSYRSRYDMGIEFTADVRDEFANFTKLENEGKALFFGDGRGGSCANCHVIGDRGQRRGRRRSRSGPAPSEAAPTAGASGNKPAFFLARNPTNNGLTAKLDPRDGGVGAVNGKTQDEGKFKVPSLRNVELTAPYMHDGSMKSLEAVIDHYDRKVEPHPNLDRRIQGRRGSSPRRLNLSSQQRRALVAFLKTLTDRSIAADARFSDPFRRSTSKR